MKPPRKKVPYKKSSKRNPMLDISTVAGRRAKNRASEKNAEQRLRAALKNPTDCKGQPVTGHLLKTIAAERLSIVDGSSPASVFDHATRKFFSALKYSWGCVPIISSLWKTFLDLVESGDADIASEFAKNYASAFRWCVTGHIHRLGIEYENQAHAIVMVEIWKNKTGYYSVGVQRNGERRIMPSDFPPECPMIVFAGTQIPHFIAPQDLERIRRMGTKRFLAESQSGKFKFSPRPLALITEDTLLNVAAPTETDLDQIRQEIGFLLVSLHYKPKSKRRSKSGS